MEPRGALVTSTTRLALREFAPADAADMLRLNADPEVLRYTGDPPFTDLAEAQALIAAYDNYRRDGFGRWSVFLRGTGDYLGWCGLSRSRATGEVDLGFRLLRACWGYGYATEAGHASLRLGFERFALPVVIARAQPANAASLRVLAKLGMRESGSGVRDGLRWTRFELTAAEFAALPTGLVSAESPPGG